MPDQPAEPTAPEPLHLEIIAEPHPHNTLTGLREAVIQVEGDGITGQLCRGIMPPGVLWLEINGSTWSFNLSDLFRQAIAQAIPDATEVDDTVRTCRVCGCTNDQACDGGCYWATPDTDICSACADLTSVMKDHDVERINSMTYVEMLHIHRNTPAGEGLFAHRETGEYFAKVMSQKRNEVGPAGHVAASKAVGWNNGDLD